MKKAKNKRNQVRQAKASVKAKYRRVEYKTKKAKQKVKPPKVTHPGELPDDVFPQETRLFWLAHGVNCLLSDYKQGTWTPLFEGIYEGINPASQDDIQQRVMDHFVGQKEWSAEAKAALAWTVSNPKLLYIYWSRAMQLMQRSHSELDPPALERLIRRPADGCTWDMFNYLKEHLLQRKAI